MTGSWPGLLTLPAELRKKIYEELLISTRYGCPHRVCPYEYGFEHPLRGLPIYPAILQTCSSVNRDAIVVLYGSNSFCFHNATLLRRFLYRIGVLSSKLIRDVYVLAAMPLSIMDMYDLQECLVKGAGLRRFDLDSPMVSCPPPHHQYLRSFLRRVKPMLDRAQVLQLVCSRYPNGYDAIRPAFRATLVADVSGMGPEEKAIDIEAISGDK